MKTNLWKSFLAVLAFATAFAFVGCTEDEPNKVEDPQIEISTATLSFTQAEESKTIDVTSNADWQVDVAAAADWVTVTPAKGNGSKTVSVTVAENTTSKSREAVVKFQALHYEWGVWDTKTLTISQSASATEIETLSEIFNDNFDKVEAAGGTVGGLKNPDGTYNIGSMAYSVSQYFKMGSTDVQVRSSGYARFADTKIPAEVLDGTATVSFTGILTKYKGESQFTLIDLDGVKKADGTNWY